MVRVARGVWMLSGFLPRLINAYLVEDVLIDALTRWARFRIFHELAGKPISLVALTHCHPDHQGVAKLVCERYGIPLACHEAEVEAMEGRQPMPPHSRLARVLDRLWAGPPHRVTRPLHDGDEVAGFQVVHTPGHTPGHVIFFRPADRLAIVGDLLHNMNMLTGHVGLHETPAYLSADAAQNRASLHRLLELRPATMCFAHGPPLRKLEVLERFVEGLSAHSSSPPACSSNSAS